MKTIIYIFILSTMIVECAGKAVKENKNTAALDTIVLRNAESELIGSYGLGTTTRREVIQRHYTSESGEVLPVILPQQLPLSFGYDWILEKWENGSWNRLKKKKETVSFDQEIIPIRTPSFHCFSFPIEYYHIIKGKYRIIKYMCKYMGKSNQEIKLFAEFKMQ